MSNDASAAAASPMTNGISPLKSHREADASITTRTPTPPPSLPEVCASLHRRVTNFLNAEAKDENTKQTQDQTRISLQVIEKALQDYDFDALSLSYNGGKDCLVLLILYLAVLHTHFTSPTGRRKSQEAQNAQSSTFPSSIPSIYAKPPDPFPAVTSFVESSSHDYHLSLTHISTNPGTKPTPAKAKSHSSPPNHPSPITLNDPTPDTESEVISFRDAFALYLQTHPSIRAIFVGTRRTDPHGMHLTHFDQTDGNWPRFMRIHPVIDWTLIHIWTFLRSPHLAPPGRDVLDYCTMYDEGYTSLGGVGDTLRNPKLRYQHGEGDERYRPAYTLTDDVEERLGRE